MNAAPFSFFNVLGEDPPILMISIENRDTGPMKDTSRNIVETKEFVVNIVNEGTVEKMYACSLDYPPEVSEATMVGLALAPSRSISLHRRAQRALGLDHKLAGELAIDRSVAELSREELVWKRLSAVGKKLRDEHGAGVLILGCAGMARYRARLEDQLGIPVVDPTQAAVGMAMGVLLARRAAIADKRAA